MICCFHMKGTCTRTIQHVAILRQTAQRNKAPPYTLFQQCIPCTGKQLSRQNKRQ